MTELPLKDDMTKAAIDYLEKQGYSAIKWSKYSFNSRPPVNSVLLVKSKEYGYRVLILRFQDDDMGGFYYLEQDNSPYTSNVGWRACEFEEYTVLQKGHPTPKEK